jgi:putative NADPH-quinone reductase
MKVLIITAHPSSLGFTHRISKEYSKAMIGKGNEVEILDLYKEENKQDFLFFENVREMQIDPSVQRMQEKIKNTDEFVFIFPLWWNAEPAILKNFFDKNFSAHFAYQYIDGKPVGLLGGKSARIFMTSDGPKFLQLLMLNPLKKIWCLARLRFCGIKIKSYVVFDKMLKRDEENRKELLKEVEKIAKK